MSKTLIVVDVQNDFVTGALGTKEAQAIVGNVVKEVEEYRKNNDDIIFTMDTHGTDYMETMEGRKLPVEHCLIGTDGWNIIPELNVNEEKTAIIEKETFGYEHWGSIINPETEEIEIIGLCTDICVISNALIIKAAFPNIPIKVIAKCCAGVTSQSHENALRAMQMCHIDVIREV